MNYLIDAIFIFQVFRQDTQAFLGILCFLQLSIWKQGLLSSSLDT